MSSPANSAETATAVVEPVVHPVTGEVNKNIPPVEQQRIETFPVISETVPTRSLFSKQNVGDVVFFAYRPYGKEHSTIYSLHKQPGRLRRLVLGGSEVEPIGFDGYQVYAEVAATEVTRIKPKMFSLVHLPLNGEIAFIMEEDGKKAAVRVMQTDKDKYVVIHNDAKPIVLNTNSPVGVGMQDVRILTRTTTTAEGNQKEEKEEISGQPNSFATLSRVEIDGEKYLLVEGISSGLSMYMQKEMATKAAEAEVKRNERDGQVGAMGFATAPSFEHPMRNEDNIYVDGNLFVIADGMGGEGKIGDGYAASRMATAIVVEKMKRLGGTYNTKEIREQMKAAIKDAHHVLLANEMPNDGGRRGGTTLIVGKIVGNTLVWASVGDSSMKVYDPNDLTFIPAMQTREHGRVMELQEEAERNKGWITLRGGSFAHFVGERYGYVNGQLAKPNYQKFLNNFRRSKDRNAEELPGNDGVRIQLTLNDFGEISRALEDAPDISTLNPLVAYLFTVRNIVRSSIGVRSESLRTIDSGEWELRKGYRVVAATDGVWDTLTQEQVAQKIREFRNPNQLAKAIVRKTKETLVTPNRKLRQKRRTKVDDISVVVYAYE